MASHISKLLLAIVLVIGMGAFAAFRPASVEACCKAPSPVHVRGHVTRSGSFVAPHFRTAPNSTQRDNWSSKGNRNPFTGKAGSKTARR